MEPVTMAFIFFLGVGLGGEINNTNQDVLLLNKQLNKLEGTVLRLAGSHASVSARTKTNDEVQKKQIENLQDDVKFLDKKINTLHP